MNKVFFAALLLLSSFVYAHEECPVLRVVDGDTVEVQLNCLPPTMKLYVRVKNIDTPEKGGRADCPAEKELADKATAHTKGLVTDAKGIAMISNPEWDKFGGRMLADVTLNDVDLAKSLLENGYAVSYSGGKRQSWCD